MRPTHPAPTTYQSDRLLGHWLPRVCAVLCYPTECKMHTLETVHSANALSDGQVECSWGMVSNDQCRQIYLHPKLSCHIEKRPLEGQIFCVPMAPSLQKCEVKYVSKIKDIFNFQSNLSKGFSRIKFHLLKTLYRYSCVTIKLFAALLHFRVLKNGSQGNGSWRCRFQHAHQKGNSIQLVCHILMSCFLGKKVIQCRAMSTSKTVVNDLQKKPRLSRTHVS